MSETSATTAGEATSTSVARLNGAVRIGSPSIKQRLPAFPNAKSAGAEPQEACSLVDAGLAPIAGDPIAGKRNRIKNVFCVP